jgi:hypothetical protein
MLHAKCQSNCSSFKSLQASGIPKVSGIGKGSFAVEQPFVAGHRQHLLSIWLANHQIYIPHTHALHFYASSATLLIEEGGIHATPEI